MRLRWAPLIFRLLLIVHLENLLKRHRFRWRLTLVLALSLSVPHVAVTWPTTGPICCFDICKYYFRSIVGPMLFNQQNKIFFQCNSLCFPNTSPTFERQQNKRYCFQILIKHLLIFVQRLHCTQCQLSANGTTVCYRWPNIYITMLFVISPSNLTT